MTIECPKCNMGAYTYISTDKGLNSNQYMFCSYCGYQEAFGSLSPSLGSQRQTPADTIKTIEFKGQRYPAFQASGNAARFAIPYAQEVCQGVGLDIGYGQSSWKFPGAIGIDILDSVVYNAHVIPNEKYDYIFSSHCLEHLERWIDALDCWTDHLKIGGVLFLYLPDYSQEYWRPWNNKKHLNIFTQSIIEDYMSDRKYKNIFGSGVDLNNSFMIFGERGE
jgi:SAM-dependent methyltransferase